MRIDEVKHREVNARKIIQLLIGEMPNQGLEREKIEKKLEWLRGKAIEGNEEYEFMYPRVVIERSHLGKGLIPFFICPSCKRKVRVVYLLSRFMACRICHHLTYKKHDRRQITINRLIRDDKLRESYLNSRSNPKLRQALEAEFALEEIREQGRKVGRDLIRKMKV